MSCQSVSGLSGQKGLKKPETDWEDKPGKPRFVIPVCFGVFWPKRAKNPKRTGMTSQGRPGLSQSVSGFSGRKAPTKTRNGQAWEAQACHPSPFFRFSGRKGPKTRETDWDDEPSLPKLVKRDEPLGENAGYATGDESHLPNRPSTHARLPHTRRYEGSF